MAVADRVNGPASLSRLGSTGRNVAANFVGIGLASSVPLLLNIVYYRLLGSESYGLIGLYVTAQMIAVALDAGLSRATTREVARAPSWSDTERSVRSSVLTLACVNVSLFILVAIIGLGVSPWVATSWLRAEGLDSASVSHAIGLMGVAVALQQPRTVFLAALNGLQRQVLTNVLTVSSVLLRGGATVAVLLVEPTIAAFFWSQVILSAIETSAIGAIVWSALPAVGVHQRVGLDSGVLKDVAPFAIADGGNVIIGTAIITADKIVLSGLVPLEVFGTYGLVSLLAQSLARLPTPYTIAYFPRFVELHASADERGLATAYRRATRALGALLMPATVAVVAFAGSWAEVVLGGSSTLTRPSVILALMAMAFACHALMHLPYALQLAHGWTRMGVLSNTIVLAIYVPLLAMMAPLYGVIAAPALFAGAMLLLLPFFILGTHRRLLVGGAGEWWRDGVLIPLAVACALLLPLRLLSATLHPLPSAVIATCAALVAIVIVTILHRRMGHPLPPSHRKDQRPPRPSLPSPGASDRVEKIHTPSDHEEP